jgi:FkbM family methyltransferase
LGLLGALEPILTRLAPIVVRPSVVETEIYLPDGIRIKAPPGFPSARSYASGIYEPEVTRILRQMLKEGMTFVDVGANIGYYSVIASHRVGRAGRVYAFEPDPRNFRYLCENLSESALPNTSAIEKAASDWTGVGAFVRDKAGAQGWLAGTRQTLNDARVETTTLDEFFRTEHWPPIHVMKMDIEGSEAAALKGMVGVVQRNPHMTVVLELNRDALERAGTSPSQLAMTLAGLGCQEGCVIERGLKRFKLPDGLPRGRATYNLLFEM